METEFEAKFYPIDKDAIRKKLREIGAKLVQPEVLTKIIVFNSKFNPSIKCHYIRVRDEGNGVTMSVKN
jgi:adenylate cyclase class IV